MLKLNKTQKEIEELAKRVPKLTDAQMEWARKNFNYFRVVRQGATETRCPDCKCVVELNESNKKKGSKWCKDDYTIRCPHCGAIMQIRTYQDATSSFNKHQQDFFQVMNVVGGWQVTRLIYMERYCYIRKESTDWEYFEVCQAWNHPEHKITYFRAFPKTCMATYHFSPYKLRDWYPKLDENGKYIIKDGWYECETKPCSLEPRRAGGANYFECNAIVPGAQILPYYKKMGINLRSIAGCKHNAMWLFECFSKPYYKPLYETLLKSRDWDLFDRCTAKYNRDRADALFTAFKICKRNGYDYKRLGAEWFDLVEMCYDLGFDYHSPHYVCPADFDAMHRKFVRLKHKKEDEMRLRKEMEKNMQFQKRIARYLDMEIRSKDLVVIVLPSIQAFKEEGDHLGHCVYSCHYYDHEDSLILSARGLDGKRWETIEVSLNDFKILQCYGYGDKFTKRHKEIRKLINDNMWQIRERRLAS